MVNNHPVHIFDDDGNFSPTAFIPFCSFGGDMKIVGTTSEQFELPVCNSFKSIIRNGQLCYQIDLEDFKDINNMEKQLKEGFVLIVDYNEERQLAEFLSIENTVEEGFHLLSDNQNLVQIHLETISKYLYILIIFEFFYQILI